MIFFIDAKLVLTDDALDRMMAHDWPGNIRELRNLIERMMIISVGDTIEINDLINVSNMGPISPDIENDVFKDSVVAVKGIPSLDQAIKETEKIIVTTRIAKSCAQPAPTGLNALTKVSVNHAIG